MSPCDLACFSASGRISGGASATAKTSNSPTYSGLLFLDETKSGALANKSETNVFVSRCSFVRRRSLTILDQELDPQQSTSHGRSLIKPNKEDDFQQSTSHDIHDIDIRNIEYSPIEAGFAHHMSTETGRGLLTDSVLEQDKGELPCFAEEISSLDTPWEAASIINEPVQTFDYVSYQHLDTMQLLIEY